MQYNETEQKMIQKAKEWEALAKSNRKFAEDSRRAREAAKSEQDLKEARERSQKLLEVRNDRFKADIEKFVKDVRTSAGVYRFELRWDGVKTDYDLAAPHCNVTFRFVPKV